MLASEFDFDLPPELIAQFPASPRDHSRLLHLSRATGALQHLRFDALPQLLRSDDLLVFNDTRVLRARLRGWKMNGESRGARLEALLLRERETNVWEALLKPSARLRVGADLYFASHDEKVWVRAQPIERTESGWIVRFEDVADVRDLLEHLGETPLPPYITPPDKTSAEANYQTVYARDDATLESSAAPTAGLHFTPRLLQALRERGVQSAHVTLGIGIGTFRPIQAQRIEDHAMHAEDWEISPHAADLINGQKARGGRVVAVGTTATRVLESACDKNGHVAARGGRTSIYIRPGYKFRIVDAMITNFHLPRSSLLVMIAAFAQHSGNGDALCALEQIRYAYREAVATRYRFFSFGDAMLIE